jgi:hypothetical protein
LDIPQATYLRIWRRNQGWLVRADKLDGIKRKEQQMVQRNRPLADTTEYKGEDVTVTRRTPKRVYYTDATGAEHWASADAFNGTEEVE